jgi:hypothetical protein
MRAEDVEKNRREMRYVPESVVVESRCLYVFIERFIIINHLPLHFWKDAPLSARSSSLVNLAGMGMFALTRRSGLLGCGSETDTLARNRPSPLRSGWPAPDRDWA